MTQLRMAVVGVGSLGQHHARKLASVDGVDLVAVVDPNERQGRSVAEQHGTHWVASPDDIEGELHGVVVATPTVFHLDTARQFLQRGIPTFVEKPLAANVPDATQLAEAAKQSDTILQVGHIERFNPAFSLAQERCGYPLYVRCQRVSPYSFRSTDIGVVHDLMIHDIELALALTDELPTSVDAFGAVGIGPHEDMAVARLKMPGGTIVDLTASRMSPEAERSLQIWGTNGCVHADLQSRVVRTWEPKGQFRTTPQLVHAIAASTPDPRTLKHRVFGEWIQADEIQANSDDAMSLELQDFIAAIRNRSTPRVSGAEGLNAMIVAESVLNALEVWSYQTGQRQENQKKAAA
ncbi:MAG: Gfo/Idh/MocA family oxidoreductase [Fuerstiella sp.]|nr:Gfo/Idh/MocA family oxidoreductase [Fuerstiella sp.]